MIRLSRGPVIVALLGSLGAATLGLTTYTLPIQGAASDSRLLAVLRAALHDPTDTLPSASSYFAVETPTDTIRPADPTRQADAPGIAHDEAVLAGGQAWVTAAAATDPAALRAWLGRWVWSSAVTDGDTIRVTLHRVSLHANCPLISRLDAVTARSDYFDAHLVRVTGTCPRVAT
ncbi:MAG: hypothetical protein SGJ01_10905 [Gemmatimonadota bacterium]|nr:hypothetical protein [Gemmatimonadota bacterium]